MFWGAGVFGGRHGGETEPLRRGESVTIRSPAANRSPEAAAGSLKRGPKAPFWPKRPILPRGPKAGDRGRERPFGSLHPWPDPDARPGGGSMRWPKDPREPPWRPGPLAAHHRRRSVGEGRGPSETAERPAKGRGMVPRAIPRFEGRPSNGFDAPPRWPSRLGQRRIYQSTSPPKAMETGRGILDLMAVRAGS